MELGWDWLAARRPDRPATALAWGDSRLSNMVFRDFSCVAVLDWDMVSLAGPEADLGWWVLQDQGTARRLPAAGPGHAGRDCGAVGGADRRRPAR